MASGSSPIESVDRALVLLTLLREQGSVSVAEAAAHLGVAPSTAHRLLTALVHRDFARQDHLRRYLVGPAFRTSPVTSPALAALRDAARPALELARAETGETVQVMVLRGGNILFLDGIESGHSLRIASRTGDVLPAFTSAGGKALLSRLNNQQLDELFRAGLPDWPTATIQSRATLKRRMTRIRQDGYATNIEETEQGVVGIGVAVVDELGRPLAGLTTATPSLRFTRADLPHHVETLRAAARILEQRHAELAQ
ncbi:MULTISPECIES: IclR family transcriptional regulator [Micrococcaceae]|uniref:IclR family transcriptional regulator n=1 Tax=Micrococcaceae TaxID=1268 RepID=UPI001619B57B|nr:MULTISPECIES: IclR family transcriptional regulator [Micrococcaceae]MBB5749551.1 DNA-binding IclR family transcriptional regulator [Micrococcus sp. TA1]HRO31423.1 IclR family transcriptional regulator [Citricoccus sp.]